MADVILPRSHRYTPWTPAPAPAAKVKAPRKQRDRRKKTPHKYASGPRKRDDVAIMTLYRRGWNMTHIANALGLSRDTVSYAVRACLWDMKQNASK